MRAGTSVNILLHFRVIRDTRRGEEGARGPPVGVGAWENSPMRRVSVDILNFLPLPVAHSIHRDLEFLIFITNELIRDNLSSAWI